MTNQEQKDPDEGLLLRPEVIERIKRAATTPREELIPAERMMAKAQLVGWCPECQHFEPQWGVECGGEEHEQTNGRLRKRLMYICRENGHDHAYFDRKEFLEHGHETCEC